MHVDGYPVVRNHCQALSPSVNVPSPSLLGGKSCIPFQLYGSPVSILFSFCSKLRVSLHFLLVISLCVFSPRITSVYATRPRPIQSNPIQSTHSRKRTRSAVLLRALGTISFFHTWVAFAATVRPRRRALTTSTRCQLLQPRIARQSFAEISPVRPPRYINHHRYCISSSLRSTCRRDDELRVPSLSSVYASRRLIQIECDVLCVKDDSGL